MYLTIDDRSYDSVLEIIKSHTHLMDELLSIKCLDEIKLKASGGNENLDDFQVFTPQFIVDGMINAVGVDNIVNNKMRILEPTSGDGAFTCRILELRLKNLKDDGSDNALTGVFNSLSTLYSIELDNKLVKEQRDNIYTITVNFLNEKGIELSESEDALLRLLIVCNFVWAETNMYEIPAGFICEVAYKMPESQKKKYKSIDFPVWKFESNKVSLHYEAPEAGE